MEKKILLRYSIASGTRILLLVTCLRGLLSTRSKMMMFRQISNSFREPLYSAITS